MKFVKSALILLFISFQCNALWSQCVLEKITLPITAQWKLQTASYSDDSSLSIEKWLLPNEKSGLYSNARDPLSIHWQI